MWSFTRGDSTSRGGFRYVNHPISKLQVISPQVEVPKLHLGKSRSHPLGDGPREDGRRTPPSPTPFPSFLHNTTVSDPVGRVRRPVRRVSFTLHSLDIVVDPEYTPTTHTTRDHVLDPRGPKTRTHTPPTRKEKTPEPRWSPRRGSTSRRRGIVGSRRNVFVTPERSRPVLPKGPLPPRLNPRRR